MIKLCIQHPDATVRKNLSHTIGMAWEGVTFTDQDADLVLVLGSGPAKGEHVYAIGAPKPLKAVIRDLQAMAAQKSWPREIIVGNATVDTFARQFHHDDVTIGLTEKEVGVIVYLWRQGKATRDDLLRDVWKYADDVDTHTIETHIYRLRQKIENNPEAPEYLITTKEGYQLAAASKA